MDGELEVTAFNPLNGRGKKLSADELAEIVALLEDYERGPSAQGLPERFAAIGLEADWFERHGRRSRPLFMAKTKDGEVVGHSLKELLDAVRQAAAGGALVAAARPHDKLIFVIDDDDSIRDLLAFAMGREGFRTDVFENGVVALQHIRNKLPDSSPDLLLLDLMMPQMGGYELLRELQAGEFPKIPVIVVTGRNIDREAVEHLRAEANVIDFIPKPLNPKALALQIHKLLGTKPARPA